MFKHANLTSLFSITKILPIPLFLIYDGFKTNLDAVTFYSRVCALANQEEPNIVALSAFLQGCMTSRNQHDVNTYSASQVFMAASPPAARVWGLQKLLTSFPALTPAESANRNPTSPPTNKPNAVQL